MYDEKVTIRRTGCEECLEILAKVLIVDNLLRNTEEKKRTMLLVNKTLSAYPFSGVMEE